MKNAETCDAVTTIADLEYVNRGGQGLQLDLHRPAGAGTVPCAVYFHGGAWMTGDRKAEAADRFHPIVQHGVAVASVSYRFTDTASHPAQIEDARAAVHWLRSNAKRLGLHSSRIGAWGASAGGWIALMLLLAPGAEPDSSVQAACALFPVTDLTTNIADREQANLPRPAILQGIPLPQPSMEARLLGVDDLAAAPKLARAASPVTHAAGAAGPVLLIHGDADGWVNVRQSLRLHRALVDAGRDSQLLTVAGANHQDPSFDGPAVLGAVAGFFGATLGG